MVEKIQAAFIIEVLGRPAEYIKEVLSSLVDKMEKEQGISILNKKVHEPKQIENKEIFTTFAEVEIEAINLMDITRIIIVYMPSHIEIISPEYIRMSCNNLSSFLSDIIMKLHQYDEIAKRITIERQILENQLRQLGQEPAMIPSVSALQEKETKEKSKIRVEKSKSGKSRKIKRKKK